jgi:glycosyltransferase involved in cell wall biosynthesis
MIERGICFIGFIGPNIDQFRDLANYFELDGYKVTITSPVRNVFLRAIDMALHVFVNKNKYKYIIIQSHSYMHFLYTPWMFIWAKILRKKYIIMYLGGAAPIFFKKWGNYISWIFKYADAVVVGSGFLEREFKKLNINPFIIPAVINLNEWNFKYRKRFNSKILWLRRLDPEYNPFMAIRVIELLNKKNIDAKLTFVGGTDIKHEIIEYSKKCNIKDKQIEYAGYIKPTNLQKYYDNHDIFINTTHVDNQPRSLLEANACGLPVVTTNVGGCPFIITHKLNGFLVDDNDAKTMSKYIAYIISNPRFTMEIVNNARNSLNQYKWENVKEKWLNLFNSIGE